MQINAELLDVAGVISFVASFMSSGLNTIQISGNVACANIVAEMPNLRVDTQIISVDICCKMAA